MSFVSNDLSGLVSFQKIDWSYFEECCAIIATDNQVHFYDCHGLSVEDESCKRKGRASMIAWSPHSNTLAIGWNDGIISLWNNGNCTKSQALLKGSVNILAWHPLLPLLLSASDVGDVCCWDCSSSNNILPLYHGSIPNVLFNFAQWVARESPYAFLSTTDGVLYSFENIVQPLQEVGMLSKPIYILTSSVGTRRLIVFHGDNELTQYNFPPGVSQNSQVKLPVGDPPCCTIIRNDVICYSINDAIYIWNIQNDETHILRTPDQQNVTSLFFSSLTAELYATTSEGSIIIWKSTMKGLVSRLGWSQPQVTDSGVRIEKAFWSNSSLSFVAYSNGRRPLIFRNHPLAAVVSPEVTMWQPAPDLIMVAGQQPTKLSSYVERASASGAYILVVTQTSSVEIFTVRSGGLVPFSRVNPDTLLVDIWGEAIFDCKGNSLECRNLQGTVKQTTSLGNSEAKFMEINGKFMVVICADYNVYLFDISRRSPKQQFMTIFQTSFENFRIKSVSLSCGGFAVSISVDVFEEGCWKPYPELFLHSPQYDKTVSLPFEGRVPVSHYWDTEDPRLLCVQTVPYGASYESTMTGSVISPMFVADSLDVYRQTTMKIDDDKILCAVNLPRVFYYSQSIGDTNPPQGAVLPQFEGLDNADDASKKSLMELNFHLATGDIDSAFNSIRGIDNKATWCSLAKTCAQMRRIDLADLCFGRMEDGGSALLLHKAKETDPDETASITVVDTQLNLYEEAKNLVKENRRFDLLTNLNISLGEWQQALTIASSSDRIHMKVIAHQMARSLELRGDLAQAIEKYEMAGTLQDEFPRLALQANDLRLLFNYISERSPAEIPPKLLLWIARFYEAHKQIDLAIEYYEYAHAKREIVRLNCCIGRWDDAATIVKKCNQRSVICFYARMLIKKIDYYSKPDNATPTVDVDKLKHDVIEQFRRARQFAQAMDFALQYEMIDDILALSFSAPPSLVCKAAQWFESQKEAKNAILLYSRAGRMNRALALCFAMKQYDALDEISDTLNSKTDPNVLLRCGQYFVESQRWSKAAQCFALAQQFEKVIELCNKHNIKLQSSVIHELSELKADPEVMKRFALLCEQQGEYQTAATLYIKFKDHLAAMKALIRYGDTEKVIKFANLIKKPQTFILAANYLQTLNPREGDKLYGQIIQFYTKAKAPDKLGRFFEASAQVEIDEYQEYSKAYELLQNGYKLVSNAPDFKDKSNVIANMQRKIKLVGMYLQAQELIKSDPKKSMSMCAEIMRNPQIENVLRVDDIYMIMVQACVVQGNMKTAYQILEELRQNGSDLSYFLDEESIKKIYAAVGQTYVPTEHDNDDEDGQYDEVDDGDIDDIDDGDVEEGNDD